jgi:hypothetical protein
MKRVRLRRERVRLHEELAYWTLYGQNVVFTSPKEYYPLNPACVPIDESKFQFLKSTGCREMRLIVSPVDPAHNWWLM